MRSTDKTSSKFASAELVAIVVRVRVCVNALLSLGLLVQSREKDGRFFAWVRTFQRFKRKLRSYQLSGCHEMTVLPLYML